MSRAYQHDRKRSIATDLVSLRERPATHKMDTSSLLTSQWQTRWLADRTSVHLKSLVNR